MRSVRWRLIRSASRSPLSQAEPEADRPERDSSLIGQDRNEGDHGDDGQVLKNEDAQGDPAVRRGGLPPVGQDLQHDGRAAQ